MNLIKSLILFGIVIVFSCFVNTAKQNCEIYRIGKFYFHNKATSQRINIDRRDSLQVETNEKGDITVSRVVWTGPCEYELQFNYMTPKEVSKEGLQKVFESGTANIPLQIKILFGTDSYYVFEAGKQGFKSLRDTVWLVK